MRLCVLWLVLGVFARPTRADVTPEVKSRSAVVLDASTGAEIFAKDADAVRPIASTTKIFVAMAVRHKGLDLDAWTEITHADADHAKGGARTRLDVGQRFRNRDLLRAMLISSDNRAPTALGRAVGLDADGLVAAMNDVARRLHLTHTHLTDVSGLHGNESTAREMAVALREALADDVIREILGEAEREIRSHDGYAITYRTTNQPLLAGRYDVIGGKTGYTEAAGYCYVTAARLAHRAVVMAFLGAEGKLTRFADFYRVAAWLDRK